MPETDIDQAAIGDKLTNQEDYSVNTETLDSATDQKETTYVNRKWNNQLGYYKNIPELKSAIDAKGNWVVGTGYKSNEITEMLLSSIKGNGVDTVNTILWNMTIVAEIGGDSFCEIIRDDKGNLINLKPLNPEVIQIVATKKGIIIRYEQLNRVTGKSFKTWEPEEIYHLSRDRIGDEIHGISVIDAVKETILTLNEAIADYKLALHRNVFPVRIYHLDTDNAAEIAAFKAKADKAGYQGENIYIPKGVVETELAAIPPNATLNPLPWINQQTQKFYQIVGTPQIVVGGAQEITESAGKMVILAWEQTVKAKQLYQEEQFLAQLNLEIELEYPVSLQNELLSNMSKEETLQASTPEDTSVTNVGVQ